MGNIYKVLSEKDIGEKASLYPSRLVIEINHGNDVHIHYRNLRLEFTLDEYKTFCRAVRESQEMLSEIIADF